MDKNFFFLNFIGLDSSFKGLTLNLSSIEVFNIPLYSRSCLRFNGPTNNELETATRADFLFININNQYTEVVSQNERIVSEIYYDSFNVFVGDNSLNSFLNSYTHIAKKEKNT